MALYLFYNGRLAGQVVSYLKSFNVFFYYKFIQILTMRYFDGKYVFLDIHIKQPVIFLLRIQSCDT